ncbi:MAG: hypothetical protein ACK4F9_07550, partial [Brevinematia bacterium]
MKKMVVCFFLAIMGGSFLYSLTPNEMVKKADVWRAPASSFKAEMKVVAYKNEAKVEEVELTAYVRDINSSMAEFTSPASWKGKKMLMLNDD